jgi:hypothetical protein
MLSTFHMKKLPSVLLVNLMGLLILTACASSDESAIPATATPVPQPTVTAIRVLPTPASPGNPIIWRDLQVTIEQVEITDNFVTEYDITRNPPTGAKFMWIQIGLANIGRIELDRPLPEHFSVLYAATEIKPSYGHRKGYVEYSTLGPVLFPGQQLDGWVRFDIPATAALKDLRFVFLAESSSVGASYSSPEYPYAKDKPTFVWKCGE